jgi:hypothetical protein
MLTSIETFLPMGPEEWEMVADNHSLGFPGMNREATSLRRKFQALYNMQVPTGDPTCPPHVRRAKRLRNKIEERADASNMLGGEGGNLSSSDEEEEEEEQVVGHEEVDEERQEGRSAVDNAGNNDDEDNPVAGSGVQRLNFEEEQGDPH